MLRFLVELLTLIALLCGGAAMALAAVLGA